MIFLFSTDFDYLLEKYDYFLFDCDGVLWNHNEAVEGAFESLRKILQTKLNDNIRGSQQMIANQKKIFFITNNSTRSREQFIKEKLQHFNFELPIEFIYTSAYATSLYIKNEVFMNNNNNIENNKVYVIGEKGLKEELKQNGINVINKNHEQEEKEGCQMGFDEICSTEVDPRVKAVVVGMNYTFSYRKLCMASLYMELNNAKFIQTNPDKYFATRVNGRKFPAGGSIVKAIEASTLETPILIGKPNPYMFEILRKEHGLQDEPLSKFLMIGDSLITDIAFGNQAYVDTLLVLSGNTDEQKAVQVIIEDKYNKDEGKPTYVVPYFGYSSKNQNTNNNFNQ